jgi:hypothetical protein
LLPATSTASTSCPPPHPNGSSQQNRRRSLRDAGKDAAMQTDIDKAKTPEALKTILGID